MSSPDCFRPNHGRYPGGSAGALRRGLDRSRLVRRLMHFGSLQLVKLALMLGRLGLITEARFALDLSQWLLRTAAGFSG